MKLRSASIDDIHLELLYVLDEAAGKRWPSLVRRLASSAYRAHRRALLVVLRLCDRPWWKR
jgi:hypothetical protein